jgi:hypothetical protein
MLKIDENCLQPINERLVVKDFGQKKAIDFEEIFLPLLKISSIRVMFGLTAIVACVRRSTWITLKSLK